MSEEVSAHNTSTLNTQLSSPHQHQWDLPDVLPAKLEGVKYGYVSGGRSFASTREHLIGLVQRGQNISFVWTPDTPEPVYIETIPFLLDALRVDQRRTGRNTILWGTGLVSTSILLAFVFQEWRLVYRNFFFVLGAVFLTEGIWTYWRSRHYTQSQAISDRSTERFREWLKKRSLSGYSITLMACIVVVGIVRYLAEGAIDIAGLVKPAVWNGEIWRLFTATLMHANFTHFWMNFVALVFLSKIIEQTVQRACVPLVFLLTAPVGSLFSVFLYPNSTSVGASGGIMGLVGFITIASYFDKTRYPSTYFRHMIEATGFTALLGLFGFAFIDNAAHLGGLVGGLLFGWFLFRNERRLKEKEKMFNYAGVAAIFVLVLIAGFTVHRLTS